MRWTVLVCCLFGQEGRVREVAFTERTVEIAVPLSGESRHVSTVVSFPEDSLEALVAGWNEDDLSLERRQDRLFIKLLRKAEGDLHVVGASGTLYRLYVRPADGVYDAHVRIVRPAAERSRPGSIDLIRSMRVAQVPPGLTARRASGRIHRGPGTVLTARYVYDSDFHRGYVLSLENVSAEPLQIDLSRYSGEGLDLVGARDLRVEPGAETLLYLVFWK